MALLLDFFFEIPVRFRLEIAERKVVELHLEAADTETVGERRIDFKRLFRLFALFFRPHVLERPHIVEAVREFNQDHADVLRHREKHLPKILRLNVELVCGPGNLGQLGHAVHKQGDILAEHAGYLLSGQYRVLDDIVQETRDNGLFVELKVR